MQATEQRVAVTSLADWRVRSPEFKALVEQALKLNNEIAAYLRVQGKEDCKMLPQSSRALYGSTTIKLATFSAQFIGWSLLHRSVAEGKQRLEHCAWKVTLPRTLINARTDMPQKLQELVRRLNELDHEVRRFNDIFHKKEAM